MNSSSEFIVFQVTILLQFKVYF